LSATFDIVSGELRVGCDELLERVTVGDTADADANRHARTHDTWIAVMDRCIDYNSLAPVHNGSHK